MDPLRSYFWIGGHSSTLRSFICCNEWLRFIQQLFHEEFWTNMNHWLYQWTVAMWYSCLLRSKSTTGEELHPFHNHPLHLILSNGKVNNREIATYYGSTRRTKKREYQIQNLGATAATKEVARPTTIAGTYWLSFILVMVVSLTDFFSNHNPWRA